MTKKKYSLIGVDGNVFSILGYVKNAMREQKKTEKQIEVFIDKATSGNYDNTVLVSYDMIEKLNGNK